MQIVDLLYYLTHNTLNLTRYFQEKRMQNTKNEITLRLTEIEINLLVVPVVKVGLGILITKAITLSDFTYGEFIIYEKNIPRFYFSVHENNNRILIKEAQKQNKTIQIYVADLLKQLGYSNVHYEERGIELFRLEKKGCIKSFKLLAINA